MPTVAQRERIRREYRYQCGYCGVHENDAGSELEIDHHRPLAHDGTDEDTNLVYACPSCNRSKGASSGRRMQLTAFFIRSEIASRITCKSCQTVS